MKTQDLPKSENVEDRRGEPPGPEAGLTDRYTPTMTLAEMLEQSSKPANQLQKDAGIDDVKGST